MTATLSLNSFADKVAADRRSLNQPEERMLGRVISCNGGYAKIAAIAPDQTKAGHEFWSIGRLISIQGHTSRLVGMVYEIETVNTIWTEDTDNIMHVHVELVGEITEPDGQTPLFSRGISAYPPLGALAHKIRAIDLAAVHRPGGREAVVIGQLAQDCTVPAAVCLDDMLSRHFAVVGTTGAGKSTAVSLLLHNIVQQRSKLRILILDPHNEFSKAFPGQSETISSESLDMPFWLFHFEEFAEVVFRGRDGVEEERDALRELIPAAKNRFASKKTQVSRIQVRKSSGDATTITADTPVPYRMSDLLALIEEEIGLLEAKHDRSVLRMLRNRLNALLNDPRYRFMFVNKTIEDNIANVIGRIFRVPMDDKPISVFQLAGMPSEVVNSVVSVLCRMAFDLSMWSGRNCDILVVCEEAHRYVPQDHRLGFGPTRRSIARIAKEGRKYGCFLGVVSQRPSELDPTILSQCSTLFAMRLANDRDQDIIRSAIADSAASTISFLSSIGNREAIAFGEGIATPMRMRFADLQDRFIPGAGDFSQADTPDHSNGEVDLNRIVSRMRSSSTEIG